MITLDLTPSKTEGNTVLHGNTCLIISTYYAASQRHSLSEHTPTLLTCLMVYLYIFLLEL